MDVCVVFCSKDKRQNAGYSGQISTVKPQSENKKNPVVGEIFLTCPDRPWGPPNLLYNGYLLSCPRVKRKGRGVNHPLPSSAVVKERVELHLYSAFGASWPVLG
jgi:hypothetical protein